MHFFFVFIFLLLPNILKPQNVSISGRIRSGEKDVGFANVIIEKTSFNGMSDSFGNFMLKNIPLGHYKLIVSCAGYEPYETLIYIKSKKDYILNVDLDSESLGEIVVTGVSKATLIRENPISVVAISAKAVDRATESNIIDVLAKYTPGLSVLKTGPNISKPFIRGLGYNRVLTLYDGIRQEGQQWGDEHGIEVDAYNIQRAEVIKGPTSLMYGSDALAGVVSLFPSIPEKEDGQIHGRILSEYQTNNNLIGNGFRFEYYKNKYYVVFRGSYRVAKNYRNAVDGRVYNTNFDEKNLSVLVGRKFKKGSSNFNITFYDNLQGIPDGSRDSLSRKFTKQIYEGADDDLKNRPLVSDEDLNSYRLSPLHQHIQHYRIYTNHLYQVGDGNVYAILAFQQNIRREYNHPTDINQAGLYVRLNTLNYGLRYTAPKFANIETTVGFNGMIQTNKNLNATDFPIPNYDLYDGGIYTHLKWKYKKWTLGGGVRYDLRKVQWKDFFVKTNPQTGFVQQFNETDITSASLQFPSFQRRFSGISASAGITYQISNQISLKSNIGRGYRVPSIPEIGSNGLDPGAHIIYLGNTEFNPEFSLQEDLGVIGKFKNWSIEVSLFNNHVGNYIYLAQLYNSQGGSITDAQGNKTYKYQQSAAHLYGAEIWFTIHPEKLKGFQFDNSLAVVYAKNLNPIYENKKNEGEYLPLIPPLNITSSISNEFKLSSKIIKNIIPKIEISHSGYQNRYFGLNNSETATPAYTLLNIGLTTEINILKSLPIQFVFQVNNIFNSVYQSHLSRTKYFEYYATSPNGRSGIYGMGRNIGFKLILTL